jgi:hypothetical protein
MYCLGIENAEIIEAVDARGAPMVPVSASLRVPSTIAARAGPRINE